MPRNSHLHRVRTRNHLAIAACLLAFALGGCSDPQEDIQSWMNEQAGTLKGRVRPLPEIVPIEPVAYTGHNAADPFRLAVVDVASRPRGEFRPDLTRRREPLEAFALETLVFVGTIEQGKERIALVRADKSLYQVHQGSYMGQDFGMVTAVSDSSLTLKELVEDLNGEWGERVTTLQLQEQQEKEGSKR